MFNALSFDECCEVNDTANGCEDGASEYKLRCDADVRALNPDDALVVKLGKMRRCATSQ